MAKILQIDPQKPEYEILEIAVSVLKKQGIIALPTETYYGLAVDPFSEIALEKLLTIKRRSRKKPILLLLGLREMLSQVVSEIPNWAQDLMDRFWPGPLTLVFKARKNLPKAITAATGTVAVRISSHKVPTLLSETFGKPITGTSANVSGYPPAIKAEEVKQMLPEVDLILDGGETPGGLPSTIVSITEFPPKLIRSGKIPFNKILV